MPVTPHRLSLWLLAVICLAFLGTARAAPDDTLGPGDSVRILVFDNPDLTTETRLSARGMIRFPLVGNVKLGGLTPGGASEQLATLLKDGKFIRDPQVSVSIVQVRSRQVSVLGQVARPGRYVLDESATTLTDILALAGGINAGGDEVVTVIRHRDGDSTKFEVNIARMYRTGDLSTNVEMENGDTIFVRRAPVFYIYGEVNRAGTYRLESDLNVMQALSLGGGVTLRGTERGIKLSRRGPDGSLHRRDVQLADPVQPDDIIQVQESLF